MQPVLGIGWDVGGWVGKKQAVAVARWSNGHPCWLGQPRCFKLADLGADWDLRQLARQAWPDAPEDVLARNRIVLGIDAPLGFPLAFAELLAGKVAPVFNADGPEIDNPLAYRTTDRHVFERFGKKPLSGSFDKLGNNATVAMVHARRLREKGLLRVMPFDEVKDGLPIGIEVYPALVKLKRAHGDSEPLLCNRSVQALLPDGIRPGDECDACVCALLALAFGHEGQARGRPRIEPIPPSAAEAARQEGWIYYPAEPWAVHSQRG